MRIGLIDELQNAPRTTNEPPANAAQAWGIPDNLRPNRGTPAKVTSLTALVVSHQGHQLVWNVSIYDRTKFVDLSILFRDINGYWASLSPEHQTAIWNCYAEAFNVLETINNRAKLNQRLKQIVKDLYELHDLQELRRWVMLRSDIKIPTTVKSEYGPKDIKIRTYLRDDYMDLALLAIALRPFVPIAGEYIERTKREIGNTDKELYAMGLLSTSKLQNCAAMNRLREYVEANVEYEQPSVSAVLDGLGTTETPRWLLSRSVIRRVAIGETGVADDNTNIISNVYHYLTQCLSSMDRNFSGKINEKRQPNDGSSDEDNMSLIETYKVKQEVADDVPTMLSVYTEDEVAMALKVDPTLDLAKLQQCFHVIRSLEHMEIQTHHITLMQWVMARTISARGIPSLNKPALLRALGVTQALLWHWEFYDLAAFMTAAPAAINDGSMMATVDSRVRIPGGMVDQLVEIYPHYQQINSKTQNERSANIGSKAIDILVKEMSKSDWLLMAPEAIVQIAANSTSRNVMIVPADIKAQLARLLLKLVQPKPPLPETI